MSDDNKGNEPPAISDDVQKIIDQRVSEELAGIKTNRDTILSEKKELQKQYEEIKNKIDKVDFNKYNELIEKEQKGQLLKNGNTEETAELQLKLSKVSEELNSYKQLIEEKESKILDFESKNKDAKKTDSLNKALDGVNVDPKQKAILFAYFEKYTDFDSDGRVVIKDSTGTFREPIEYIKEWSGTDSAKPFVIAPLNMGGGGNGSIVTGTPNLGSMTQTQLHQYAKDNPNQMSAVEAETRKRSLNHG